ncbi:hypothetical protein SUDANB151_03565 [Streptomyces sp. enrichment culture]
MPRSTVSAWTCNDDACPICIDPERDEMSMLRCAILTLLDQGRWMAGDDIPPARHPVRRRGLPEPSQGRDR